jgi:hypothetical protein
MGSYDISKVSELLLQGHKIFKEYYKKKIRKQFGRRYERI